MILQWLGGLVKTRTWRLAGVALGTAAAFALAADLGVFIQQSTASMTQRAISGVGVDWQVELVPGASTDAMVAEAGNASPALHVERLGYGTVASFTFTDTGGTQVTGAGKAVGLDPGYYQTWPDGFRVLAGDTTGGVLLQQTAANLHARPGDTITLELADGAKTQVNISGIVDLKTADTFFQAVGVPSGAAPQAPPDNAVLLPPAEWSRVFAQVRVSRPDSVREQLHIGLDHALLPVAPEDAYRNAVQAGHNFEVRAAGSALLANNLAARLDATRADALYARVLFLFLGSPGVVLAILLTVGVATAGAERRQRDLSLLRLRGASQGGVMQLAAAEGAAAGVAALALGYASLMLINPLLGLPSLLSEGAPVWTGMTAAAALLLSIGAVSVPAWQAMRSLTVAEQRLTVGNDRPPLWERLFLDVLCLALAGLIFWRTAASGYQVVLATEGVAAIAVDYTAFLAPLLLWVGSALLTVRCMRLLLGHGHGAIGALSRPLAGNIAPAVGTALANQRRRIAGGTALAALAVAFAISTSVFNTTYESQARVDAQLTNGADVTVRGTMAAPLDAVEAKLRAIPGVADLALMQHRFAYVGTDLQDLYGIDPATIGNATTLANAYFEGQTAGQALATLAGTPNAALVSDETVKDFQLSLGDTINLRLQGADGQYRPVPFVFTGVIREFPTAPRDSFIVANAAYVAAQTKVDGHEYALLRTGNGRDAIKSAAMAIVSGLPGAQVGTLDEATHTIGSSLTAVDLGALSRLELIFAILLAVGATGLTLGLGLADRRRGFAVLTAIGATPTQLAAFIVTEVGTTLAGAVVFGAAAGWLVAEILVLVLQGVFDPPPETLSYPLSYLLVLTGAVAVASTIAVWNGIREGGMDPVRRIKELQ
jgi:putative ABC transport system permease protein